MNQRRPRGRNNNNNRGRHQNPRNQTFDSNGPEGRVRGSATQVLDRYLAQARDAQAAGDGVLAENLFQHAEHYYRVLSAANAQFEQQQRERQANYEERRGPRNEGGDGQRDGEAKDGEGDNRESKAEDAPRAAEADAEQDDAPKPRGRRRPAAEKDDAPAENEAASAEGGDEIDAAFLKADPKPRRRRKPIAETEAAD